MRSWEDGGGNLNHSSAHPPNFFLFVSFVPFLFNLRNLCPNLYADCFTLSTVLCKFMLMIVNSDVPGV